MPNHFDDWLSNLQALPFWSDEWLSERAEDFQRDLTNLIIKKREQRDELRGIFDKTLAATRTEGNAAISFFGYETKFNLISSLKCRPQNLKVAVAALSELQNSLGGFSSGPLAHHGQASVNYAQLAALYWDSEQVRKAAEANLEFLESLMTAGEMEPSEPIDVSASTEAHPIVAADTGSEQTEASATLNTPQQFVDDAAGVNVDASHLVDGNAAHPSGVPQVEEENVYLVKINEIKDQAEPLGKDDTGQTSADQTLAPLPQGENAPPNDQANGSRVDLEAFEFETPSTPSDISGDPQEYPTFQQAEQFLYATSQSEWQAQVWELLARQDISGAFQLAHALESCAIDSPLPSGMLAVLHGALLTTGEQPTLLASLSPYFTPGDGGEAVATVALAAALPLTLIFPELRTWLLVPNCAPALKDLVEQLEDLTHKGWHYNRSQVASLAGEAGRTAVRDSQRNRLKRWIEEEAPNRQTKYPAATDAWVQMVIGTGPIRQFVLDLINNRKSVDTIREEAKRWLERDYVSAQLNKFYEGAVDRRREPIAGEVVSKVENLCREFAEPALTWCEIAASQDTASGFWQRDGVADFRNRLGEILPEVETALRATCSSSIVEKAGIGCLMMALGRLRALMLLGGQETAEETAPSDEPIATILAQRLWQLPELNFSDDGALAHPVEQELARVAVLLLHEESSQRDIAQSVAIWRRREDYRFEQEILRRVPAARRAALEASMQAGQNESITRLSALRDQTAQLVQSSLVSGVLDDREGLEAQHQLVAIQPRECFNFAPVRADLLQIQLDCALKSKERGAAIADRWRMVRESLRNLPEIALETVGAIDRMMASMLHEGNFRAAEQLLDTVDTATVRGGTRLEPYLHDLIRMDAQPEQSILQDFLRAEPRLIDWLDGIAALASLDDENPDSLPKRIEHARERLAGCLGPISDSGRRHQTAGAVCDWLSLFELGYMQPADRKGAPELVGKILRQIGFILMGENQDSVQIVKPDATWMTLLAKLSDGGQSPVPLYGSLANKPTRKGDQAGYPVLLLWGNPTFAQIEGLLHTVREKERPLIVFHLGILRPELRQEIATLARHTDGEFLILSFQLFLYLAHQGPGMLRSFFRTTLPFSAINPYIRESGIVWQEMFFGREEMIDRVMKRDGSSVIYGGRQLGKSALQKHLERRYHQASPHRYVFLFDMRTIYAPQQGLRLNNLLFALRNKLLEAGLIPRQKMALAVADSIRDAVVEVMNEVPERQILLLLDEADDFLEASAREAPPFFAVNELLNLMDDTDYRFKVVFAGNYNTQRFSHIPNQRLTRSGEPVVVGPLETTAAIDLIRKPTEALGFQFESLDVVLRILSYTNSHANLLQYFMHELLRYEYSRPGQESPPYVITARTVDQIYSRLDVQETMQHRIALTLKIDKEYRLISFLAALHDQGGAPGSQFTHFYRLTELLSLAREYWPAGFANVTVDLMRSKLDEMCGLGLLIRNQSGQYRLSSASMMRLFGNTDEIREKVNEIATSAPDDNAFGEELHAWVGDQPGAYTPLTYAQAQLLARDRYAVRIVLTSGALGGENIVRMLPSLLPSIVLSPQETGCRAVPSEIQGGAAWSKFLRDFWARLPEIGTYVLYQQVTPQKSSELNSGIRAIQQYLQRVKTNKRRSLRIVLLFNPTTTWIWRGIRLSERQALEQEVCDLIVPRRWSLAAIRRRLLETNHNYADPVCARILETTGGWPLLLDELIESWRPGEDSVGRACQELSAALAPGKSLANRLVEAIGIDPQGTPGRLFSYCASQNAPTYLELLPEEPHGVSPEDLGDAIELLTQFGVASERSDELGDRRLVPEPLAAAVWRSQDDHIVAAVRPV